MADPILGKRVRSAAKRVITAADYENSTSENDDRIFDQEENVDSFQEEDENGYEDSQSSSSSDSELDESDHTETLYSSQKKSIRLVFCNYYQTHVVIW